MIFQIPHKRHTKHANILMMFNFTLKTEKCKWPKAYEICEIIYFSFKTTLPSSWNFHCAMWKPTINSKFSGNKGKSTYLVWAWDLILEVLKSYLPSSITLIKKTFSSIQEDWNFLRNCQNGNTRLELWRRCGNWARQSRQDHPQVNVGAHVYAKWL